MQSIPVEPRGRNVPLSDCLSVCPFVTVLFFMFAVYVVSLSCSCLAVLLFQSVSLSVSRLIALLLLLLLLWVLHVLCLLPATVNLSDLFA